MRAAYNDWDDRAELRGYVQFNKYTYTHTHLGLAGLHEQPSLHASHAHNAVHNIVVQAVHHSGNHRQSGGPKGLNGAVEAFNEAVGRESPGV